jgi:lipoprotein-anchoring transpeptidase ErfK/SrfK
VVGNYSSISRRWIETPEGYVYSPNIQPVYNKPNVPMNTIPETPAGKGFWAEITVPYVDLRLERDPCAPWLNEAPFRRLYYSQVMWIDDMRTGDDGQVLYRVNEKYGNCGDIFWAAAEGFRPITEEEMLPIHPDAAEKRIVVSLSFQTLSCYEGNDEVFFTRVSTGAKFNAAGEAVDAWSTPIGVHTPWRKVISIHMAGGSTGAGYDTPGIAWTTIFDPKGAAIHSTFWHNDFGTARSHGCVNCLPEDAKWIFRWASPTVNLYPGDVDLTGVGGSTLISVVEQ